MGRMMSALAASLLLLLGTDATAHGGGLNADGCHHNRKTGDYHCHRGGGQSSQSAHRASGFAGSGNRVQRFMADPGARKPAARSGGAAYFPNCAAARAAGAAPIRAGEPGYARRLDRDGDGVACE
ncbi:MAG: hypothetical protein RL244_1813 [Pseudomonadota bacterium]|jgi:hypothetical protein|uniref:excalibur calcium-binding domain-containing protein n=1 Tax=Brachymonas denitrificans TaxID=28220 RepID=UPI00322049DD